MATCIDAARLSPLRPRFGVEVHGIQLADIAPDNGYSALRHLFDIQSLLLFRKQEMSDSQHLALGRIFGPIEDRNADEHKPGEQSGVSPVTSIKDDGTLMGEKDMHTLHLKTNMLWHIDSTFCLCRP